MRKKPELNHIYYKGYDEGFEKGFQFGVVLVCVIWGILSYLLH